MKGKPPAETEMPAELRDHLDGRIREYKAIRQKENNLQRRREMRTTLIRAALAEVIERYEDRVARLVKRRKAISDEFLQLWAKHLPKVKRVVLPSAAVSKRRDIKVTVLDKREVIAALDRLDRLDLVDQVINEKGLRKLARDGKLDELPETALGIARKTQIQATTRKEE